MTNQDVSHLTQAIVDLKGQIERMAERQDEMIDDVKKIKEAVYNPDSGLYARIRDLEQWKQSQSRIQWTMMTAIIGLVVATVYKAFITI